MPGRYHDVMRELVDAVVGGDYAEGSWLPSEVQLAQRFGTSRGSLREALRGLEERGLVTVTPGRGQLVRQREEWDTRAADVFRACVERGPDPGVLANAIEARRVLEHEAASCASQAASPADIGLLVARVEAMDRALAPDAKRNFTAEDPLVQADAWFHRTLALLSENPLLAKLIEPLQLPLAELRRINAPDRDRAVVLHHRRIIEGLSSREAELAVGAVDEYARQLTRWLRSVRPRRRR